VRDANQAMAQSELIMNEVQNETTAKIFD